MSYAGKGMYKEAESSINRAIETFGRGGDAIFTAEAEKLRALILGMAGKREESLTELERLLQAPVGYTPWELKLHPQWDFFRDDERFNALATPPNLNEAQR